MPPINIYDQFDLAKHEKMSSIDLQKEGTIPDGKYTFIGLDIDATGKRILDEIVHLAAYSPTEEFDQYVIPVMNLNPAARQRHRMRIITVGFFRMLKCTLTNKVVKCKTEITAIKSFLEWLEERKQADPKSKGIVLIYHEPIKFIPYMLLEALKKYDLLERFGQVVSGFVDGHAFIDAKGDDTVKNSLIELAKAHLDFKEDDDEKNFEGNAMVRARLAYKLLEHFGNAGDDVTKHTEITTEMVQGFVHSLTYDMKELTNQNKCIDLQHTFRPIFVQFFKTNLYHRYKAVTFRRVLAEKGFDLKSLEAIWEDKKKDGLTDVISKLDEIKEEYRPELVDILDSYFDPSKEQIVPVARNAPRRRPSFKKRSNKENRRTRKDGSKMNMESNNNDMMGTPDSTSDSPTKSRRRSRRRFPVKRQLSKSSDTNQNPMTTQIPHQIGKPILPEIIVS